MTSAEIIACWLSLSILQYYISQSLPFPTIHSAFNYVSENRQYVSNNYEKI